MSIQATHWVFFGVALTVAGTLAGIWLKHHLDLRKEGLLGVQADNIELRNELNGRITDNHVRQAKIDQLQATVRDQRSDLANMRIAGDRLFTRLADLHPEDNWTKMATELGWPPRSSSLDF